MQYSEYALYICRLHAYAGMLHLSRTSAAPILLGMYGTNVSTVSVGSVVYHVDIVGIVGNC
jgi:hypothetical protein